MSLPSLAEQFSAVLGQLAFDDEAFIPRLADLLLAEARSNRASDVHLIPREDCLTMQWRIDGVLHTVTAFDTDIGTRLVARLKVMAGLLTYRTDVPQEGRVSLTAADQQLSGEVRVTTFPTLFGEKAAIRLFAETNQFHLLSDLGLPEDAESSLRDLLQATSGVVLLTGPSGSGKTTTVYACLRELLRLYGDTRGMMTLEDPVESVVPGVTQSQVRPASGFDLATGLKSMMRQDPDVIMIGEIRDPVTAECAFQAALTGHLVLTTFHAGSSVEAITRLLDMGIEPYLMRSTLQAVVCQRLLRKLCDACQNSAKSENISESSSNSDNAHGDGDRVESCRQCGGLTYRGRFVTAELLNPNQPDIAKALMNHVDSRTLRSIAESAGLTTLRMRAEQAVRVGLTRSEEVFRVLGGVH